MTHIDLSDSQFFDIQLEFVLNGEHYDLHNDFDCYGIGFDEAGSLAFRFKGVKDSRKAELIFYTANVVRGDLNEAASSKIIANFQRIKLEAAEGLREVSEDGRKCFLVEFEEGLCVEILASKVEVILQVR